MRVLALLVLAGCAASRPTIPPPLASLPHRPIDGAVATRALGAAIDNALPGGAPASGLVRVLHGPTACRPRGGVNPLVVLPTTIPTTGQPLDLLWTTRACPVPALPSEDCWLVWSTDPLGSPLDFTPYGMPGCSLTVRPDYIVRVPEERGGTVWRDGGEVRLRISSPPAGLHLFIQLVVAAPGETPSGWLASAGVEILVGG